MVHPYATEDDIPALKARNGKAQGGGCEAAETLGRNGENKSPERATQRSASPFQGSIPVPSYPRACALGFAVSRFRRSEWISLTRIPERVAVAVLLGIIEWAIKHNDSNPRLRIWKGWTLR